MAAGKSFNTERTSLSPLSPTDEEEDDGEG
jgi:hypothetical protein